MSARFSCATAAAASQPPRVAPHDASPEAQPAAKGEAALPFLDHMLAGSLAGALWWLAGPLLDEQTKKKVRFVSRPDGLHAHIHPRFVKAAALGGAPIGE